MFSLFTNPQGILSFVLIKSNLTKASKPHDGLLMGNYTAINSWTNYKYNGTPSHIIKSLSWSVAVRNEVGGKFFQRNFFSRQLWQIKLLSSVQHFFVFFFGFLHSSRIENVRYYLSLARRGIQWHGWSALAITYSNPSLSLSLTTRNFFEIWFTLLAALVSYAKERTQLKKTVHWFISSYSYNRNVPRMGSQRTWRF